MLKYTFRKKNLKVNNDANENAISFRNLQPSDLNFILNLYTN